MLGVLVWVKHLVDDFICNDGENPFCSAAGRKDPNMLKRGRFGVERDAFDDLYERPCETHDRMRASYGGWKEGMLEGSSDEEDF